MNCCGPLFSVRGYIAEALGLWQTLPSPDACFYLKGPDLLIKHFDVLPAGPSFRTACHPEASNIVERLLLTQLLLEAAESLDAMENRCCAQAASVCPRDLQLHPGGTKGLQVGFSASICTFPLLLSDSHAMDHAGS